MSERTLLLGYDLGNEKTQMAVFNRERSEPDLVGQTEENPDAMYDTAIVLKGHPPITGFLDKIRRGEEILVDGKTSNPVKVLAYYFRKTLTMTKKEYPSETIKQLVVTAEDLSPEFVNIIYQALEQIGIGKDRAAVMGHKHCFLYYVLSQKRELWVNDVGMFDYGKDRLRYYQMQVDRRKSPIPVGILEKDFSDALEVSEQEPDTKAVVFENVVYGAIHKQILSTLYMTGSGFEQEWCEELFTKLCVGRRLFKGSNLYVSGACYGARELGETRLLGDYFLLDEDMVTSHLSVSVYGDAKEQEVILVKAGTPWYQIDEMLEIIPDGEDELDLKVTNIFTKESRHFMLSLEPVAGKTERQCRLAVRVRFSDSETCIITVKDRGFGEIFPTSNRIWEKTLTIA